MENNEQLIESKFNEKDNQNGEVLDVSQNNQDLTNDQKLEYLCKLIQDADKELEKNDDINKELIKNDDSLR